MKNEFVKSILNYYAAFTETRFSNKSTLNYKWLNDTNLTLDISFFSDFHRLWLNKLRNNDLHLIEVHPDQYKIEIPRGQFVRRLSEQLNSAFNLEYLKKCILEEKDKNLQSDKNNGKISNSNNKPQNNKKLEPIEELRQGIRTYNLHLRKGIEKIIFDLQKEEILNLENTYHASQLPAPTFNVYKFTQDIYDNLQRIAEDSEDENSYFGRAQEFLNGLNVSLTLYDLYLLLKNYAELEAYGTVYLFCGSLASGKTSQNSNNDSEYPLFFIEVSFDSVDPGVVKLSIPRDLVVINTPAINSFDFDIILPIPRASSFAGSINNLRQLDGFFITGYKLHQQDIALSEKPYYIPGPTENLPLLKFRFGFQVIKNEDKRLLDYSELMTRIEKGLPSKIVDFVDGYLNGNVKNTVDETESAYKDRYPDNTPQYYVSDNPLPLNAIQKRILTALANLKNKVIVVDGPPGTGKSHAIAAITYWANQNSKSIVITSHKKEALDVVDRMLTDKFKDLHPYAKPSVIRITKTYDVKKVDSLNAIDNSLSLPVVNAATARVSEFNQQAIESDKEKIAKNIASQITEFITKQRAYPEKIKKIIRYLELMEGLKERGAFNIEEIEECIPSPSYMDSFEHFSGFGENFSSKDFENLSLQSLIKLYQKKQDIPGILHACEEINCITLEADDLEKVNIGTLKHFDDFKRILERLFSVFDNNIPISRFKVSKVQIEPHGIHNVIEPFSELLEIKRKLQVLLKLKPKIPFLNKRYSLEEKKFRDDYPHFSKYWGISNKNLKSILEEVSVEIEYIKSLGRNNTFALEFIYSLKNQEYDFNALETFLKELDGLRFSDVYDTLSRLLKRDKKDITLKEAAVGIKKIETIQKYSENISLIEEFRSATQLKRLTYKDLFIFLEGFKGILEELTPQILDVLNYLNNTYGNALKKIGIDFSSLNTLFKIKNLTTEERNYFDFIKFHSQIISDEAALRDIRGNIGEYNKLIQRLTEFSNDLRIKDLHNYHGDIEKIKLIISKGKRLTTGQAKILLSHFSCIIAEPEAIFKYLPMEEDLIDILVFDEASQVSISHSISLILRAKQVVVFGDKYQYGAVSAVNVSQLYAGSYFKRIIDNYKNEYKPNVPQDRFDKIIEEESKETPDEDLFVPEIVIKPNLDTEIEWLRTFSIRTSTLSFCEAIANYHTSLTEHFRSFKEIIDYSNDFFYKRAQIPLIVNRLRTKPISDVLRFIKVETQGKSGQGVNIDEIEAIRKDIEELVGRGFKGTIGIITSFREQKQRADEYLRKKLNDFHRLREEHKLTIWFVGDVQGEERDIVYYSLVQDKKLNNGDLRHIYPIHGGVADNIKSLKMQRLNVGFSRPKDTMVFVHSMNIDDYSDSELGDALKFYYQKLQETKIRDYFVPDESIFESPKEKELYNLLIQTDFFCKSKDVIKIIPQFDIGKYIKQEFHRYIPKYRVDFLITLSEGGKERSLVLEYDGLEYHTKDPEVVRSLADFREEYLEYDIRRQLELESYGYHFLRINKFTLLPKKKEQTRLEVLSDLLEESFRL